MNNNSELDTNDQRILEEHAVGADRGEPDSIIAILTRTREGQRRGYMPTPYEWAMMRELELELD